MTQPYYQDDLVTLYHGDCLDVLPTIPAGCVDVLLTDPPYFNVKPDEWDRQWSEADEFLRWLGSVLDAAIPALTDSATAWVFASPALTSAVEREVVAPRLRVLNSIRWVKEHGWHQKAEIAAQRRYLTAWEGVILAERTYADPDDLRKRHMVPVGRVITEARESAGVTRRALAARLTAAGLYKNHQTGAAMCSDWEHGDSLPPPAAYQVLTAAIVGLPTFDEYASRYDAALRRHERTRRPFFLSPSGPTTDVWAFPTVAAYPGKHPCEKPQAMLAHMIRTTSRLGATILDPFAGSGSTLRAAKDLGRHAIGVEQDERYCERIAQSLSQECLFV